MIILKLPIKRTFKICCDNCEDEFLIDDLDHVSSDEREMGTENQYEYVKEIDCPSCHQTLEVAIDIWEYPENTLNSVELVKVSEA